MERTIKTTIPIAEVYFDEKLYPRAGYNWQTGYDYSQSMRTGVQFPPITLALINNKKVLIDGKHRLEAYKLLKKDKIEAEIFTGWNQRKAFEEAIKRNIAHGRVLSPYEKRMIALKLKEMEYNPVDISQLIQVPQDKLEGFIATRLVNSITGETIKEVIVKSELSHLAGTDSNRDIQGMQKLMSFSSQLSLIDELIYLIESKLIDNKPKVQDRLKYLKSIIQ